MSTRLQAPLRAVARAPLLKPCANGVRLGSDLGVARIVRIVIAGAVIGGGHRPFGSIVSYRRCSWYVEACREHALEGDQPVGGGLDRLGAPVVQECPTVPADLGIIGQGARRRCSMSRR